MFSVNLVINSETSEDLLLPFLASTILNRLKRQFMDKHSANIPFNVDEMISIMAKNLQYYFDHYTGIKDLCPVLQEFKNKLFNIFMISRLTATALRN